MPLKDYNSITWSDLRNMNEKINKQQEKIDKLTESYYKVLESVGLHFDECAILDHFVKNENEPEALWYMELYGVNFRKKLRSYIRKLHKHGYLERVDKGVYRIASDKYELIKDALK